MCGYGWILVFGWIWELRPQKVLPACATVRHCSPDLRIQVHSPKKLVVETWNLAIYWIWIYRICDLLSRWLDDTITGLIPLTARLDNVIYWKIDVVSSHARRLEESADDGKRLDSLSPCWPFGCLLVAFWEPLGALGLLEFLGSCGKDPGCFLLFLSDFYFFEIETRFPFPC